MCETYVGLFLTDVVHYYRKVQLLINNLSIDVHHIFLNNEKRIGSYHPELSGLSVIPVVLRPYVEVALFTIFTITSCHLIQLLTI
jgi:hypothetical protein